jgi:hypothetical protein
MQRFFPGSQFRELRACRSGLAPPDNVITACASVRNPAIPALKSGSVEKVLKQDRMKSWLVESRAGTKCVPKHGMAAFRINLGWPHLNRE